MKTISPSLMSADRAGAPSAGALDFHVFLAYENMASALRATDALGTLVRKDPDGLAVRLSPWSFAALECPEGRTEAAPCVERAELIVIAACGAVPRLSAAVESWLRTCLGQRSDRRLAMAALVESDNSLDCADSPRLQSWQRLAQETGCAFFAPGVAEEITCVV